MADATSVTTEPSPRDGSTPTGAPRRSLGARLLHRAIRALGWLLIISGAVVLLYVVYLLWFTGLETERAQRELADRFGEASITVPGQDLAGAPALEPQPVEVGAAFAALWFERDGERVVDDDVLYVVEGVSLIDLRRGPGHYPDSDRPGGAGNLAIAGHRTTYGSPFWALDTLQEGDTIHVLDPEGREWIYAYTEQRVVAPTDVWVVGEDPLGTGRPTITLTTCHPRGSDRQRLIAWGELVGDPIDSTADGSTPDELPET